MKNAREIFMYFWYAWILYIFVQRDVDWLLVSQADKLAFSVIRFPLEVFFTFICLRWRNISLAIDIHLFRCMILTYILQFRLIRHRLFPSYIIVNKLMNIPRGLALLIGMKTLANPLTYLLNKSSRLAKKSDLVLLLLLLLSWLHFILLLPTTTITLTTCYYYYY